MIAGSIFQVDNQAILYLFKSVDDPIDFSCPDPYSMAVECGIGTSQNPEHAIAREFNPIPVTPHLRILFEVTFQIPGMVLVVPEIDRHSGHGLCDDHFSGLIPHYLPVIVVGVHGHPECPALNISLYHRLEQAASYKRGTHIGSSTHRTQPYVFFNVSI